MTESNNALELSQLSDPSKAQGQDQQMKKTRIMLVDEHTVLREGLCALLKDNQQVETIAGCSNPEEALKVFEDLRVDLVMIDAMSSQSSAFEFVKELQKKETPPEIIFFASRMSDRQLEKALKLGVKGFLSQLDPLSGILSAINHVMVGEKYF
jgi:Response regulator containing a CheY-like receiver domain and an HTH DNA-binding domain